MGLNHGLYRGMKSSSIPRSNQQTFERKGNGEIPSRITGRRRQTSGEISSMIRYSVCCSTSLLSERNCGRQMNPLQLKQLMMSSLSSSSIIHKAGSISATTHVRPDHFGQRKSHRLKKTELRLCASYRSGRSRNAVVANSIQDGCA